MNSLRVCIFTETYYPVVGGGETQARLLAEGLRANGHQVVVLARRSDAALPKVGQVDGVTVYRLPPSGRGQLKKWGLILTSFPKLIQLRHQYDLIFVSGFRIVGITAVLIGTLLDKQVVLKADSQGEMSGAFFTEGLKRFKVSDSSPPFKLFLNIRNNILKQATAFTAITNDTAAEIKASGVIPQKIHMIPNTVNTAVFHPVDEAQKQQLRRSLELPLESKLVVYTGRLVSYKGLPLLLEVWHQLQQKYPAVYLLLVGTGGLDIHNCEAELKTYVKRHHLEQTVCFTGPVQNVSDYLQAADIFAFPTENDAFPSSLIEAMTCQLPVITTPVGAIDTIITHEQNGLLVRPGDFQTLYQALEQLLTDNHLAQRLGTAGWQTVQERYAAAIVFQKYIRLFQQLTQTKTPSQQEPEN